MSILEDRIEHVVVLMLENRSFDSMLGTLYPKSPQFNGLDGSESNPLQGAPAPIKVWNQWPGSGAATDPAPAPLTIPDPDPGELWNDINMQIFGRNGSMDKPTMQGFADNYALQKNTCTPANIMHYYNDKDIPVLSTLARQYAVCDQWHASAPCQTWPNRFFAHTGTAGGWENNSPAHFPDAPTIFTRFNKLGLKNGWKIYFHDMPQSLTLRDLWPHPDQFRLFEQCFASDAAAGKLPSYTFIEPRYFTDATLPNDQHPPHNVLMAEKLIADVYNSVRNAPTWDKTLLIITYDEHGGCYDHVAPPAAVAPEPPHSGQRFDFKRYGVRVPAVLISPYIQAGSVLRAARSGLPDNGPPYPYDHTSIIATLRKCFKLGDPLTARDAVAPDLDPVLTLRDARTDCPKNISATPYEPTQAEIDKALAAPLTDMQEALHSLCHALPSNSAGSVMEKIEQLAQNVESLVHGLLHVPSSNTPASAVPLIKQRVGAFLNL